MNSCETCGMGRCQPTMIPYPFRAGSQILMIPDAPAWLCDVCGEVTFDAAYVTNLELLIHHDDGGNRGKKGTSHLVSSSGSSAWRQLRRSI